MASARASLGDKSSVTFGNLQVLRQVDVMPRRDHRAALRGQAVMQLGLVLLRLLGQVLEHFPGIRMGNPMGHAVIKIPGQFVLVHGFTNEVDKLFSHGTVPPVAGVIRESAAEYGRKPPNFCPN